MIDRHTAEAYFHRLFLRAFALNLFPGKSRNEVQTAMLQLGSEELLKMQEFNENISVGMHSSDPAGYRFKRDDELLTIAYTELSDLEEFIKANPSFLDTIKVR